MRNEAWPSRVTLASSMPTVGVIGGCVQAACAGTLTIIAAVAQRRTTAWRRTAPIRFVIADYLRADYVRTTWLDTAVFRKGRDRRYRSASIDSTTCDIVRFGGVRGTSFSFVFGPGKRKLRSAV